MPRASATSARSFEITLALAYELASDRSDRSWVDPEQERVLRCISESSWDFHENHSFQLFVLHQDDHSPTEQVGDTVSVEREDDSDARLTWVGARQTGIFDFGARGYSRLLAGRGRDARARARRSNSEIPIGGRVEAEEVIRRDVSGWARGRRSQLAAAAALRAAPLRRLCARLRGVPPVGRPEQRGRLRRRRAFRQLRPPAPSPSSRTSGSSRWEPALSLFRSSSLDLVYHHYRLYEPSDDLRDSELQFELDDEHKDVGHEVDLVLALEEWERLEFTIAASALRTSNAFGSGDQAPGVPDDENGGRAWVVGGFLAVRYGF